MFFICAIKCGGLCAGGYLRKQYLFFGDAHIICDIREDGGLDEKSLLTPGRPSTLQHGSLLLPALYQLHYLIKLLLVYLQIAGHIVLSLCVKTSWY